MTGLVGAVLTLMVGAALLLFTGFAVLLIVRSLLNWRRGGPAWAASSSSSCSSSGWSRGSPPAPVNRLEP
jgi:hypothetical protein